MNSNLTELAFILDRSGSMASLTAAAIEGFNHFLREQQEAPGNARLTLVLFDDEYLVPAASLPVAEVLPLDATTYVPRNSTALLDAIGRTIDDIGARLAATAEAERPGKVIFAILTDGLENASTRYTWREVGERIQHQRQKYQWDFLFLGANQDAIATACQLHIDPANAATYRADRRGQLSGSAAMAKKMRAARALQASAQAGIEPLAEDLHAAGASMAQLLREEDKKLRDQESGRQ